MKNASTHELFRYVTPESRGIGGRIKIFPSDFVVEEIPLYDTAGFGEHVYLCICREGMSTREVAQTLSRLFDFPEKEI